MQGEEIVRLLVLIKDDKYVCWGNLISFFTRVLYKIGNWSDYNVCTQFNK